MLNICNQARYSVHCLKFLVKQGGPLFLQKQWILVEFHGPKEYLGFNLQFCYFLRRPSETVLFLVYKLGLLSKAIDGQVVCTDLNQRVQSPLFHGLDLLFFTLIVCVCHFWVKVNFCLNRILSCKARTVRHQSTVHIPPGVASNYFS